MRQRHLVRDLESYEPRHEHRAGEYGVDPYVSPQLALQPPRIEVQHSSSVQVDVRVLRIDCQQIDEYCEGLEGPVLPQNRWRPFPQITARQRPGDHHRGVRHRLKRNSLKGAIRRGFFHAPFQRFTLILLHTVRFPSPSAGSVRP
jgi:hypothetical protein